MDKSIANLGEEQTASMNILNDYVLIHIFRFLKLGDRIRFERVCNRWKMISRDSWSNVKIVKRNFFQFYEEKHDISICFRALIWKCGNYIREMELPDFSTRRNLSEEIISDIVQFCPNLNSLDISAICVNGSQIQHLADNYKELTSLTIGPTCGDDCDIQLQNLFERNKNLKYVHIEDNTSIRGECLLSLPTTLTTLYLRKCSIERKWIRTVLRNLYNLKHLDLFSCTEVFDEIVSTINTHCLRLEQLKIGICDQDYTSGVAPIKLKKLQILELIRISSVNDEFLNVLTLNCQKLNTIYLTDNQEITDVGINYLARLPHLEKLYVINMYSLTAAPFAKISTLKILECHFFFPITELFQFIKVIPNLQVLYITDDIVINPQDIEQIREILSERTNKLKVIINETEYS